MSSQYYKYGVCPVNYIDFKNDRNIIIKLVGF